MEYSPREFMKSRRPEKFSDSVVISQAKLNRSILEYNLSTITSRNGERLFESFAVKLAQLEICPNLRVQTGPVGGGDSKADSETYPVSELSQLTCYIGISNENNERWAFAISAKKTWTTKVASDVEGISSTGRNYSRVFFITNQFARDKKRAELEDSLSQKFGIAVTVLDLNWILDRVYTNNRLKLAIDELQLGEGLEEVSMPGQLDIARSRELDEINTMIETAVSRGDHSLRIIKKALKAAILARELERPRSDVDGFFDRALRFTKQYGSREQLFHVKYQQAWTAYFWYEDFSLFASLYNEVEDLAIESSNIFVAERLNNLWQVLKTMNQDLHPLPTGSMQEKTQTLNNYLTKFVINESSPSAGLQARAILSINKLMTEPDNPETVAKVFDELRDIFKDADMLIGFPYDAIYDSVQEFGNLYPENPSYEQLLNDMMEIDTKRKGDVPAAVSCMQFGIKQYRSGNHYKAIDYLGKSLARLYKEESRNEFVSALYWLGNAYEKAGLLWAARGAWINAASSATNDYWKYYNINWMQSVCYSKLKFIELRLGRIAQSLEWHQLDYIISNQLVKTEEEKADVFQDNYYNYGMILACLLIKTPIKDMSHLEKLPDILFSFDSDFAAYAVLYLLDGRRYLPEEFTRETDVDLIEIFSRWQDQPAQHSLPAFPLFYTEPEVYLRSKILGAEFEIATVKESPGIEIAETLLASFESFLSTAINIRAVARIPKVSIKLILEENGEKLINYDQHVDVRGNCWIKYKRFNPHKLSKEQSNFIGDALLEITAFVVANIIMFPDGAGDLRELIGGREVYDRSFSFGRSMVTIGNVLGFEYKHSIYDWYEDDTKIYPYVPDENRKLRTPDIKPDRESDIPGKPDFVSHDSIAMHTVINERVWSEAGWRGVSYMGDESILSINPPALVLMFSNAFKGQQIFELWKEDFASEAGNHVRIAIIKGIDKNNPYWYTVSIGPYRKNQATKKYSVVMTRLHTMNAESHRNLDMFTASFKRARRFWLAPGFSALNSFSVEPFMQLGFFCKEFIIKNAWEIGLDDEDASAIVPGSEPIIPTDRISDAPILETLKFKEESKSK